MEVLCTNENNPATLKLLIAANYAKRTLNLKIVNTHDKNIPAPKILPYLQVNRGQNSFFIANAAARYLHSPVGNVSDCEEWLEWEATVLAPIIAHIGNISRMETLRSSLNGSLRYLNDSIVEKTSLCASGNGVAVCDIAIWSTLYPLYHDLALTKEYLNELQSLLNWLQQLERRQEFQLACERYKVVSGITAYQALLSGAKYALPSAVIDKPKVSESAQHSVEIITPEEIDGAKLSWLYGSSDLPNLKKEVYPVLPVPGEKNVLITSALPYVNNVPHLGNIIGCVLSADVFARFCRLCNYNTLYISGTDEYGTATETKALEEGLTPQQICDKYFEVHNSIYRWFNIGFDYFGRTTTPEQTELVQNMFLNLNENGFTHTETIDQFLCENCNRYLADRFVEGGCPRPGCNYEDARGDQCDSCGKLVNAVELKNPRCKVCSRTPIVKQSKQYFLDLPKLEPLLLHWIEKSSPGWSNNARLIGKSWLKEGLKPRCITRDLKWGIPVPVEDFKEKVFYVWFDAPIGYISMTYRYTKQWEKWWRPASDTAISLYQFMAKDNVPFHSIMFPGMLLGCNKEYVTVSHIMATEYLNYEDGKFSKSRGFGVFGNDAQDTGIPSDVWRFYLLYVRPESQDSSFSWVDLATKNNSELLNNLGNFVNRTLVFAEKNFNSTVPEMKPIEEDYRVLAMCTRELKGYMVALEKAKLRDGIRYILAISRHGNQYMQSTQPWVLVKGSDSERKRAGTVIGICCNLACLLATLLFPYMPESSRTIKKQLNAPSSTSVLTAGKAKIVTLLPPGHVIGKPALLFTKIEAARVEELKKRFAGKQKINGNSTGGDIVVPTDISGLEIAVEKQGENVRALKANGAAKTVWQPEVTVLLGLKKKLEAAQTSTGVQNGEAENESEMKELENAIEKQGMVVRKLKERGASKTECQTQVDILLQLKNKLAVATGKPLVTSKKTQKSKK